MRKNSTSPLLYVFLVLAFFATQLSANPANRPAYAPDLIRVKLSIDAVQRAALPQGLYAESNSFGVNELDQLMAVNGGRKVIRAHRRVKDTQWEARTGFDRWFLIKLDGRTALDQAIASFKANRYVEDAVYEYYAYPNAVPNDPLYSTNWGHNNTAQFPSWNSSTYQFTGPAVGIVGWDTDAQLAWDLPQGYGSADIVVAIIDSGVDTTHPDLRLVTGYDFGDNDTNPMDNATDAGHGTLCAGVTAARANNSLGVTGIAGGCSIMPLKVANSAGSMTFTAIANAITYAKDNGADVISMSLGANGISSDPTVDPAITAAYNAGVVLFAATGNYYDPAYMGTGVNEVQDVISYPANNQLVISVGASSPGAERKSYTSVDNVVYWGSCYGVNTQDSRLAVDIMAPSLLPSTDIQGTAGWNTSAGTAGNYYSYFGGTSCATPYAAGVAALLLSRVPTLTPAQIRSALINTAMDMTIDGGAGWDRYTGYGMINAYAALAAIAPGIPTCVITYPTSGSTYDVNSLIPVSVTASDSDGSISSVAFYVNNVLQFTDYSSPYAWTWNSSGYAAGSHEIKAIATDNASNTAQSIVSVILQLPPDEGFETGNFSTYPWVNNSAIPWTVQSAEKYSGVYAAKSGAISHSAQTDLSITLYVTQAGNISFYQRVSSESGYDYLRFFIDGAQQGQWSGAGSWTQQSYAVSPGTRTFLWRYIKDSSVSNNSDCAWIDHIIFPPTGVYYAPPQNLSATTANQSVTLNWSAPGSGTPTGYKIFRNGNLLTTVTGLSYTDQGLSNGTTYSYYLKAVYSDGESEATATVNATPIWMVAIGSGTSSTGNTDGCPINTSSRSLHGQSIYTAAELNAAGVYGPVNITQLGFYVNTASTLPLTTFVIRMKHTTDANVANWQTASGLTTVYTNSSYTPVAGNYHMLTLGTPFTWNGIDNILIDTAFARQNTTSNAGTVRYTTVTSGYRFVTGPQDQTSTFSGGSLTSLRPNVQFTISANMPAPIPVPFAQGFETGLSDWIPVNGTQTNKWTRGTAAANSGLYGFYISNDGGTSNSYTLTSASTSHAFRDLSFPSGSESWKLRFNWKGQGQNSLDYMRVYLVDTTVNPAPGTALSSGGLGSSYLLNSGWQEVTLDIPSGVNGSTKRLVFSWTNDASGGTNPPAAIDDIRIVPGSQTDAAVVINNTVSIVPPPVTDPQSNLINTSIQINGISQMDGFALVTSGYASVGAPYEHAGLDFVIGGLNLAGSTVSITHNLGFVPSQLAYKLGDSGAWNLMSNPGSWSTTTASFTVPASKAANDVIIAFPKSGENTLPVELSSFTATINAHNKVLLTWVTQTESNCLGYHIFRNSSDTLDSAIDLQTLITATNTSQQQVYIFEDSELQEEGTWHYWLQSLDMDGSHAFFGPFSISYYPDGGNNNPGLPLTTELLSAYPNPFNPVTWLRYSLKEPGKVSIQIYNSRGQKVRELSAEHAQPGFYKLIWDGKDSFGKQSSSGIYFYRMSSGSFHQTRKMVLAK